MYSFDYDYGIVAFLAANAVSFFKDLVTFIGALTSVALILLSLPTFIVALVRRSQLGSL